MLTVTRRLYLNNLIIAEMLIIGLTDQGEPVDIVYLDFSKAFDSMCHRWSCRWDLPLNACKSHHLSIGGPPDLRVALSEEAEGKSVQKRKQINDLGTTVNPALTTSANVLTAATKAKGHLHARKQETFVLLYSAFF